MVNPSLILSTDAIAEFCRRHHIRKLAFFGSILEVQYVAD